MVSFSFFSLPCHKRSGWSARLPSLASGSRPPSPLLPRGFFLLLPSVRDPNSRPPKLSRRRHFYKWCSVWKVNFKTRSKNAKSSGYLSYRPTSDWLCPNPRWGGSSSSGGQMSLFGIKMNQLLNPLCYRRSVEGYLFSIKSEKSGFIYQD